MKTNWLTVYDKIDDVTLRESFYNSKENFSMHGRTLRFCPVCRRWVSVKDYRLFCSQGYHEFAEEVKLRGKRSKELVSK